MHTAVPPRLAHALKHGTQESHRAAENVHFIREFIRGRISRDLYRVLVAMLYYVYTELETQMRAAAATQNVIVTPLHFPAQLERVAALAADLAFYYGPTWQAAMPPPSRATAAYVARLRFLGETAPSLLLAHAYTRYMGDLSGGQILKRTAIKAMQLEDGQGTGFYDFDMPHKAFKDQYRRALDDLPATPEMAAMLVQEANVAFLLNMAVFEELDVMGGLGSEGDQRQHAVTAKRRWTGVCPFASLVGQPGVAQLALKYHGDDLSAEDMADLRAAYIAEQDEHRQLQLKSLAMSLTALGIAIGFGIVFRRFA
ncbi:Aste57867_16790 [Aphanomyces stellatus]|uniref:Aste57867_16790 protein n=1 Tax=Aphanomyces stellatus TaxID=120398 RepID=A0A485L682_9STRA|nr:hypothetical protein As57867_016733 [Aphanomyces stellatus]VFT93555.1 Aste57867_16790 [Aphanomyces stellatus]